MSGSLGGGFIPSNRPSKACKATNNIQTMQGNKLSANARLHYMILLLSKFTFCSHISWNHKNRHRHYQW